MRMCTWIIGPLTFIYILWVGIKKTKIILKQKMIDDQLNNGNVNEMA